MFIFFRVSLKLELLDPWSVSNHVPSYIEESCLHCDRVSSRGKQSQEVKGGRLHFSHSVEGWLTSVLPPDFPVPAFIHNSVTKIPVTRENPDKQKAAVLTRPRCDLHQDTDQTCPGTVCLYHADWQSLATDTQMNRSPRVSKYLCRICPREKRQEAPQDLKDLRDHRTFFKEACVCYLFILIYSVRLASH